MEPAESIVKFGFRRWYERQLIESHAYLVTGFLCLIVVCAGIEEFNIRAAGLRPFIMLALTASAGLIGIFSWRRYLAMLGRAEHIAERSTCKKCHAHAAITVTACGSDSDASLISPDRPTAAWLAVKCRKCGNEWTID
jgi:ribosomal protein L40E